MKKFWGSLSSGPSSSSLPWWTRPSRDPEPDGRDELDVPVELRSLNPVTRGPALLFIGFLGVLDREDLRRGQIRVSGGARTASE